MSVRIDPEISRPLATERLAPGFEISESARQKLTKKFAGAIAISSDGPHPSEAERKELQGQHSEPPPDPM
jgi:hypothetical protein